MFVGLGSQHDTILQIAHFSNKEMALNGALEQIRRTRGSVLVSDCAPEISGSAPSARRDKSGGG